MPRARKRKAEPCESNQIESETAPVPHEPSDKEASCDEVPVSGAAHQSCKDEHRLVLKGVAAGMCKLWKSKVAIAKKAGTKLRVAQAGRIAKYEVWNKRAKQLGKQNKEQLWDKMMLEDERVAEIEKEYYLALVDELVHKNGHTEALLACRDATIRDLRARVREPKKPRKAVPNALTE